jgi:hypothetical protein
LDCATFQRLVVENPQDFTTAERLAIRKHFYDCPQCMKILNEMGNDDEITITPEEDEMLTKIAQQTFDRDKNDPEAFWSINDPVIKE